MKQSFVIVAVRPILAIAKPIIVLEVQGGESIIRNPKQLFTDLQNSGRLLGVHPREFAGGVEGLSAETREAFIDACHELVGATVTGDINNFKKGDAYPIREGHPALTDKTHPSFGKVKVGDTLKAESDGQWIEGFLSIPLTKEDRFFKGGQKELAKMMMNVLGMGVTTTPVPKGIGNPAGEDNDDNNAEVKTAQEAVGTKK